MDIQELDKLRLDDIEFFARRYSELFGEYFDKNTSQEKEKFYKEIKEELLEKVSQYVAVAGEPVHGAVGISYPDHVELSENWDAVEEQSIRNHELFHSYNYMKKGKEGLKDFEHKLVLKNLDEGSTEMFSQMMCGNESKDTGYIDEVELTRFLTSIVGERTMLHATRGNPQLLCEITDRLLGTQGFLQNLEKFQDEKKQLISQSCGEDRILGIPVSEEVQILSQLKLEVIREKDEVNMLFDAVQRSNNQQLYHRLRQVDAKFGYHVIFERSLRVNDDKISPKEPTLASMQQEILKAEIDELKGEKDVGLQAILEIEIKKFLYDRIRYQKHFINHPEPEYGVYELTPEDTEFSENFKSDLDGVSERLGGKIGLFGPGNRVYSLENIPYIINEKVVKSMFLQDVGFYELQDYRLELWAEKLNLAQTKKFLDEWTEWIYNVYYKKMFFDGNEASFREAIEGIKRNLAKKEQGLVDKYKVLEKKKQQEQDGYKINYQKNEGEKQELGNK